MKSLGYYNGKIGPVEELTVPFTDRGLYFGDGVYDATCAANHIPFALDDHIDRFFNSFQAVRIPFAMSKQELRDLLLDLCARVDDGVYLLYWHTTRGCAARGHAFPPEGTPANLLAYLAPCEMTPLTQTMKLMTAEDLRHHMLHVKTLNLLPNVLTAQQTKENGCDEVVYHRGDRVTEGFHSNILMLKDGALCSPPADNLILPGITRKHLLEIARQLSIPVKEEPFTLAELMEADEVLVTNSSSLCNVATEIDGKPVGGKAPLLLRSLQQAYAQRFNREVGLPIL
ncbi:MAG TPA: aminotransferase class IV [Firmicutes bacterium]|nr:aminotransferase class IV [Bacillota bacterium]